MTGNVYPIPKETFPGSLFGKPTRKGYRAAIKSIVLGIQAAKGWDDQELADFIGCGKETIENARTEAHSLDVLTLLNIAYAFGENAIQPVRDLYLCKPVEPLGILDRVERIEAEAAALRRQLREDAA
jgi:uncharacterized protein (DUF433 family)